MIKETECGKVRLHVPGFILTPRPRTLEDICTWALHWSHIGMLISLLAAESPSTPISVSVEQSCYPVFAGVGLAGFKSRANDFLLV